MASVFKRSNGIYYVTWLDPATGKRLTRSTKSTRKRTAEQTARQLQQQPEQPREQPLSVLAENWLDELKAIGRTPKHVSSRERAVRILGLDVPQINRQLGQRSEWSDRTVVKYVTSLRQFGEWCVENGHRKRNPMAGIKKPTHHEWNQFCEAFSELLQAQLTDLLIIDPIANFAPWKDENSASDVSRSLEALDAFTTKGIAILACHHAAKHSGDPRGSTALTSRPDIILKLKYRRERSGNDTVDITDSTERILSGTGRFMEVPKTLPLAFNEIENEYVLRQSGQQRAKESSEAELRCILRDAENPLTRAEILDCLDGAVSDSTLRRRLDAMQNAGEVTVTGEGAHGSPFRYAFAPEPF